MGITRTILDWSGKKFQNILDNEDTEHPYLKSFGLGMLEGAIDLAVITGPLILASCILKDYKELKR